MKLPRLKMPELDRGRLSRRAPRLEKGLQAPKPLRDLFADLRDRRLLPIVALLLVAIVAAPLLLGKDGKQGVAAVSPIEVSGGANRGFTVAPAAREIRAYGDRLGYRKPRDPFGKSGAQDGPGDSSGNGSSSAEEGGSETTETHTAPEEAPSESDTASEASSESDEPSVTVNAEGSIEVSGASEEVAEPSPTSSNPAPPTQITYVATGIDAKLGFLGRLKQREKVAPMTKLPNSKRPVVVYVGESSDKKGALFLMSSNVTAYSGGGRCALSGQVCQLLELRPGKSATFSYGYGSTKYKVQLRGLVGLTQTEATKTKKQSSHSSSPSSSGGTAPTGPAERH